MTCPVWAFSRLAVLSLVVFHSLADPSMLTAPDTVIVETGEPAILKCRIADRGEHSVIWRRVDHDFVISENTRIVTDDLVKYSILPGPDGSVFDLMILGTQPSDQGFYECKVKGTDQAIVMHLDVAEVANFNTSIKPLEDLNMTDCCNAVGVSSSCLPACVPDPIDLDVFNATLQCGSMNDLAGLSKCFADGSNHDACCLARGVDPMCLVFCHDGVATETLTLAHLGTCFTSEIINGIFDCFASGSVLLPGPPTDFRAIYVYDTRKLNTILLKWSPPSKNSDQVEGYVILYKTRAEEHYTSIPVASSAGHQYRLDEGGQGLQADTVYQVYVVATTHYGGSLGSVEQEVFVGNGSQAANQEMDIDACCSRKGVSDDCRNTLCRSKTWSHFSFSEIQNCSIYMEEVFSCLTGQIDHTVCCSAYDVNAVCLPLCTGHPPDFNSSFVTCIYDMSIIEACVQQGNDKLPLPPRSLSLEEVTSDSAVLIVEASPTSDVQSYIVEMNHGADNKDFNVNKTIPSFSRVFRLSPLLPNTYYNVRVITVTSQYDSLPSETVSFLTYPASDSSPTAPPDVNIPVDMMDCCRSKGMPELCWRGCVYAANITSYYYDKLDTCQDHIGSVLTCAADGRDHSSCCIRENISPSDCVNLCTMSLKGPIPTSMHKCVSATPTAVLCYMEGILDLPRHPDIMVKNVTSSIITVEWSHPETSSLIEEYILEYGQIGENKTQVNTPDTMYILQDLQSGAGYEISAKSVNENGTSISSPTLTVFTLAEFQIPPTNHTAHTGRALWTDIVDCCEKSGIDTGCMEVCKNTATADDVTQTDQCLKDDHKMLACFNDGQDHSVCCKRANLPNECLPLCAGHTSEQSVITSSCMSYGHRQIILGCILENQDLVPGTPTNFIVKVKDQGAVDLSWVTPTKSCYSDCTYTVHYWKDDSPSNVTEKRKVQSPLTIDGLDVNTYYVFTVNGQNQHGAGAPAPWETLFMVNLLRDVSVRFSSNKRYVERGTNVRLICATIGFLPDLVLSYHWSFNSRTLDGETGKTLELLNVNHTEHEGRYTCTVNDNVGPSSDTTRLNIQYLPSLEQLKHVPGYVGSSSRIECVFQGFPDSSPDSWLLNEKSIDTVGSFRHEASRGVNYYNGLTTYKISIKDTREEDYGDYNIIASNKFGNHSCTAKLQNPATTPTRPPARKQPDPLQCCKDQDVSGLCLELCDPGIDVAETLDDTKYMQCLMILPALVHCGADGRDHTKCCKNKGVVPYCFPFCEGNIPEDFNREKQSLCDSFGEDIFACGKEGHSFIPYAPHIKTVTKGVDPRTIVVRWQPPEFNHDYVGFYTIHHDSSDPNVESEKLSVNEHITEYTITDVIPGLKYTVYITAGNVHGKSLPSNEVQYTAPSTGIQGPTSLTAKKENEKSTLVQLSWSGVNQATYEVHVREVQATAYTTETTAETSFVLKNLWPAKSYMVYVTAIVSGKTSNPSNVISVSINEKAVDTPTALVYTLIVGNSSVRLSWQGSHGATFMVHYKTEKASLYSIITTKQTYQIIPNLASKTKYMAYIVAFISGGSESGQSDRIYFTTGISEGGQSGSRGNDDDDNDDDEKNKAAIGIGVAVGLIAVVVIILFVIFFIYRHRLKNESKRASETVTFENPGYGAQGSVKFGGMEDEGYNYGRLCEEHEGHHYDNPATLAPTESSTDPHIQNNPTSTFSDHGNGSQQAPTLDINSS